MIDLEYATGAALKEGEVLDRKTLSGAAEIENDRGLREKGEYLAYLSRMTLCVTMIAGAGTRWKKSLSERASVPSVRDFDAGLPRALFPVNNILEGGGKIAIGAYAVNGVRDLGDHLLVISGFEQEIRQQILAPLGMQGPDVRFFRQEAPGGQPLGHGDAAWQARSIIAEYEYVTFNFGGDLISPETAALSLMTLDALDSTGVDAGAILPVARVEKADYPIKVDENGLPVSFGHAKLTGAQTPDAQAYTNIGFRVYRTDVLLDTLTWFHSKYFTEGAGYSIPGNSGNEFALDNVDAFLAEKKVIRLLPCAQEQENVHVKQFDDIERFENAIKVVLE